MGSSRARPHDYSSPKARLVRRRGVDRLRCTFGVPVRVSLILLIFLFHVPCLGREVPGEE